MKRSKLICGPLHQRKGSNKAQNEERDIQVQAGNHAILHGMVTVVPGEVTNEKGKIGTSKKSAAVVAKLENRHTKKLQHRAARATTATTIAAGPAGSDAAPAQQPLGSLVRDSAAARPEPAFVNPGADTPIQSIEASAEPRAGPSGLDLGLGLGSAGASYMASHGDGGLTGSGLGAQGGSVGGNSFYTPASAFPAGSALPEVIGGGSAVGLLGMGLGGGGGAFGALDFSAGLSSSSGAFGTAAFTTGGIISSAA
ncbi:hypothetical protein RB600_002826 [Gaeumannomyces tritici]